MWKISKNKYDVLRIRRGNREEQGMNCIKCGAALRKDATFCLNCGQKVAKPISVGGMIGIAIVVGVIPGLLSWIIGMSSLWYWGIYAFYFMFICYLFSLKYVMLSITIMEVLVIWGRCLYTRFNGLFYDIFFYGIVMLVSAFVINLLAKKNRLFIHIFSVLICNVSFPLRIYYIWARYGEFPFWQLWNIIFFLLGSSCSACICWWIRKHYPQLIQRLR